MGRVDGAGRAGNWGGTASGAMVTVGCIGKGATVIAGAGKGLERHRMGGWADGRRGRGRWRCGGRCRCQRRRGWRERCERRQRRGDIQRAAKGDCRSAYRDAGVLAVVPLVVHAARADSGCKS